MASETWTTRRGSMYVPVKSKSCRRPLQTGHFQDTCCCLDKKAKAETRENKDETDDHAFWGQDMPQEGVPRKALLGVQIVWVLKANISSVFRNMNLHKNCPFKEGIAICVCVCVCVCADGCLLMGVAPRGRVLMGVVCIDVCVCVLMGVVCIDGCLWLGAGVVVVVVVSGEWVSERALVCVVRIAHSPLSLAAVGLLLLG